jgi:hypothetical protein
MIGDDSNASGNILGFHRAANGWQWNDLPAEELILLGPLSSIGSRYYRAGISSLFFSFIPKEKFRNDSEKSFAHRALRCRLAVPIHGVRRVDTRPHREQCHDQLR